MWTTLMPCLNVAQANPISHLQDGWLWDGHTPQCRWWLMFLLSWQYMDHISRESKHDVSQFEGQIWGKTSDLSVSLRGTWQSCCLICLKVNSSMVTTLWILSWYISPYCSVAKPSELPCYLDRQLCRLQLCVSFK